MAVSAAAGGTGGVVGRHELGDERGDLALDLSDRQNPR